MIHGEIAGKTTLRVNVVEANYNVLFVPVRVIT